MRMVRISDMMIVPDNSPTRVSLQCDSRKTIMNIRAIERRQLAVGERLVRANHEIAQDSADGEAGDDLRQRVGENEQGWIAPDDAEKIRGGGEKQSADDRAGGARENEMEIACSDPHGVDQRDSAK